MFVDTNAEEAFDLVVLANRMLLIIEERNWHSQSQPTPSTVHPAISSFLQSRHFLLMQSSEVFFLDSDNDGTPEMLVQNYKGDQVVDIFDYEGRSVEYAEVERLDIVLPETLDVVLADVDGDGQQEVVCNGSWTAESGLLFYKYRDGKYEALNKDAQSVAVEEFESPWFISAHIADIDNDGRMEIVSEPWRTVPRDLLPKNFKLGEYDQGRVRYVWRWDDGREVFQLLSRKLLYVGAR